LHTAQHQQSHDLIAAIRRRKLDAQSFRPDLIGKRRGRDDKTGCDAKNRSRNPASETQYRAPQGHKASRGGVLRTQTISFSEVGLTQGQPPCIFSHVRAFSTWNPIALLDKDGLRQSDAYIFIAEKILIAHVRPRLSASERVIDIDDRLS
jgi:hypothetical protein